MSAQAASQDISPLWTAESIAVVGASPRAGSTGGRVVELLHRHGYRGRVYPVHPRGPHQAVSAIEEPVELAVLLVRAALIPSAVDDCLAAGVRTIIIEAAGFAETDEQGAGMQGRIAAKAREAGARILGPNCIGTANLHNGLITSFSPFFHGPLPEGGNLAVVSHSGGVGFGITSLAVSRGITPGWVVTTGNEADITAGEVMWKLGELPQCRGVLAFLESLPDHDWLARFQQLGKPAVAILTGQSSRPAETHGLLRATDVDELLDIAAGFGTHTPTGARIGVVTTSGGAGAMARDACAAHGFRLPAISEQTEIALRKFLPPYALAANPLDITATVAERPELLGESLSIMLREKLDAVLVCLCVLSGSSAESAAAGIAAASAAATSGTPVLVSRTGCESLAPGFAMRMRHAGIPVHPTPARALAALARPRAIAARGSAA